MQKIFEYIKSSLDGIYSKEEIRSISFLIFKHILHLSKTQVYLKKNEQPEEAKLTEIKHILGRLCNHEPIQYVLGETEFYGLVIKVNPSTLIPRQETEELVEWIISDNSAKHPHILDIGVGSGCISIALSANIPGANIHGWDISPEALAVAEENAQLHNKSIHFKLFDIAKWKSTPNRKFNIIVSNPPYVTNKEKKSMERRILEYEPHIALFVPDNNPLIFYHKIASFAKQHLATEGKLYLEINETLGSETIQLLQECGFSRVTLKKDINGKDRIIRASLDSN